MQNCILEIMWNLYTNFGSYCNIKMSLMEKVKKHIFCKNMFCVVKYKWQENGVD